MRSLSYVEMLVCYSPMFMNSFQSHAMREGENADKGLLPDVVDAREISVHIAKAVIKTAVEEDLNQKDGIPNDDEDLEQWVRAQMWHPEYRELVKPGKS